MITLVWATHLQTPTNRRGENGFARSRRVKKERNNAAFAYTAQRKRPPKDAKNFVVKLTRIAPRPLDGHDNLQSAFKATADEIVAQLGLKSDRKGVTFEYEQERPEDKAYCGVRVEIRWET